MARNHPELDDDPEDRIRACIHINKSAKIGPEVQKQGRSRTKQQNDPAAQKAADKLANATL